MTSVAFPPIDGPVPTVGEIKFSLLTADHKGWFRMDGRAAAALPAAAGAALIGLGFVAIPDAATRNLRSKPLGTVGGSLATTRTLAKANLPAYVMTVTSNTSPNTHTHTLSDPGPYRYDNPPPRARASNTNGGSPLRSIDLSTDGAHVHAFTLANGGGGAPIDVRSAFLSVSAFIFLGVGP